MCVVCGAAQAATGPSSRHSQLLPFQTETGKNLSSTSLATLSESSVWPHCPPLIKSHHCLMRNFSFSSKWRYHRSASCRIWLQTIPQAVEAHPCVQYSSLASAAPPGGRQMVSPLSCFSTLPSSSSLTVSTIKQFVSLRVLYNFFPSDSKTRVPSNMENYYWIWNYMELISLAPTMIAVNSQ